MPAPIVDKLRCGRPLVSIEFFPPKTEEGARQILRTAHALRPFSPDFVSITYGAGGSTRERTLAYAELIQDIFGYDVMPHLTCVGHSRQELRDILVRFRQAGFRNIMALRGDPPKGETAFRPHPDGLAHAADLVAFIREHQPDCCLGVAGYPEKHPEAPSLEADIQHLAHKVAQGAAFVTTQLFFDNADYFAFVRRCREAGIGVPILPGILPVTSVQQLERLSALCGAKVPPALAQSLREASGDEQAIGEAGLSWALQQIRELVAQGAPGCHLYILNRAEPALVLYQRLRDEGLLPH